MRPHQVTDRVLCPLSLSLLHHCRHLPILDDPVCAPDGHIVLDGVQRQVSSSYLQSSSSGKTLCDGYLKEHWYRFEIDGKPAEAAAKCPNVFSCGTKDPVWIVMQKKPELGMIFKISKLISVVCFSFLSAYS